MSSSPKEFSSIHNHSHYSLMDGLSRPEEMVLTAKEKGLKSIALTDHGHMHGTADFYLHGKKHDVKTIYGVEAYCIDSLEQWVEAHAAYADDRKRIKAEDSIDDDATNLNIDGKRRELYRKGHLVLLAQNQQGLENLYELTHRAHKDGMYMKPRIDKKMLGELGEGIVASSACMGGVIANKCWALKNGDIEWKDVVKEAEEFRSIFNDRFFLELQFNESDSQRYINECIIKIHRETGIPLDVTSDAHYINPDDWEAQEILYMLRGNKTVKTRGDSWDFNIKQLYIKSADEMWEAYKLYGGNADESIVRQAFDNTLLIDSMISDFEPDTHQRLPTLDYESPYKKLGELAIKRMKELGLDSNKQYKERFLHEMKLIRDKGFAEYFLIMRAIIRKAKKQMLVGPGRGSAASSLVCYLNGITDLDPIKHNLLFERFINPDRLELPDIDTDFQDSEEAREMLREMFGEDNVACISTYNTFNIKGLLKDLGRVYDLNNSEINQANKKIEAELRVLYADQDKSTIVINHEDIERVSPTYRGLVEKFPELGKNIKKLYGRNRHVGRHACGVVIGDNLKREMALFTSKGILQTSFTQGIINKNVEEMGFIKFDLLSLSTLSVIDRCLKLIGSRHDMEYDEAYKLIDPTFMDINDPEVIKTVFVDGNFTGIFQFTNKGIRKVSMRIKPDCFNDVSAIGALYRPGPLKSNMDKLYADYKHNPELVEWLHPLMEDILKETHGCLVYQEQMLNIGTQVGKLSMKDTNRLRKLLLKKDKSKKDDYLQAEKKELIDKFVTGCKENGLEKSKAITLWEMLEAFGGYGFNAAHAKSYGMISMQTAYLRTYYPLEFYCALLTEGKADDLQSYVDDIKRQGFEILPVDINQSKEVHTIEGKSIRLALGSVLGVGESAAKKIVKQQPYDDFMDYLYKTGGSKTATLPLIKVGAFRSLSSNVAETEARYELWVDNPKLKTKKFRPDFEEKYFDIKFDNEHPLEKLIEYENELLGFNLIGSPFELFDRGQQISILHREGIISDYDEFIESEQTEGVLPVIVKGYNERAQRRGGMMAWIKFGDRNGIEFEAPCFATIWRWINKKTVKGNVYLVTVNRKLDDPRNLIVGKSGFAHTEYSAPGYMINVDDIK